MDVICRVARWIGLCVDELYQECRTLNAVRRIKQTTMSKRIYTAFLVEDNLDDLRLLEMNLKLPKFSESTAL